MKGVLDMSLNMNSIKNRSVNELLEELKEKSKKYHKMKEEIDLVKSVEIKELKRSYEEEENRKSVVFSEDKAFEDEIKYYYENIRDVKVDDNLKQNLEMALPSKKHGNYEKINLRLRAELLREIKIIYELIEEEVDKDDLIDLKGEISNIKIKSEMIKSITEEQEKSDTEVKSISNQLIFTETSSGNIRILDEIDHIDQDYYDRIIALLNSIKDGSFKNVKRFRSINNKTAGVSEVKLFKVRVLFEKVEANKYAIISVFVKKSDMDKGYVEQIGHRISVYKNQEDEIKSQLSDDVFLMKNREIEQIVYTKLLDKAMAPVKKLV